MARKSIFNDLTNENNVVIMNGVRMHYTYGERLLEVMRANHKGVENAATPEALIAECGFTSEDEFDAALDAMHLLHAYALACDDGYFYPASPEEADQYRNNEYVPKEDDGGDE